MTSMTPKTYQAVLYARRHFVDIVQPDEPDPPAAEQIKEMKAFVKELPDVKVSAIYMDGRRLRSDGPRPQFYNMMREIQDGKYDCVVISSFDKFAKDVHESRYYLMNLLALLRLRIISVQDDYDSLYSEPDPGKYTRLEEQIALIDKYARSRLLSAKAKEKKANSYLELTFTPYGYLYTPDTESNLDIDPVAAPAVQFIFKEFLSGSRRGYIADELTKQGYPSPSLRKKQLGISYSKPDAKDYWTFGGVNYILRNQAYVGDLIFGQQRSAMYVYRECRKHHWTGEKLIVRNHHEALVSREDFERVQIMLELLFEKNRSDALKKPGYKFPPTPFKYVMRCGHCGRPMQLQRYMSNRHPYSSYVCTSHVKHLENPCPPQKFLMEDIIPAVKDALLQERKMALSVTEMLNGGENSPWYLRAESACQAEINAVLDKVKENSNLLSASHTDPEIQKEADRLRGELSGIIQKKQNLKKFIARKNPWLELFRNLPEEFDLTQEITKKYIHQIDLYRDKPLVVTPKEYKEKKNLFVCLNLQKGGEETDLCIPADRINTEKRATKDKGEQNGTEEPSEGTVVSAGESPGFGTDSDSGYPDRNLCPSVPV